MSLSFSHIANLLIQKGTVLNQLYERAGSSLRFVGGCVRDACLGRLSCDMDLATPLEPDQGLSLLKKAGIPCIPTGLSHGTFTAVFQENTFEITTLRRDILTNGRHASVVFSSSWEEDARRRDFTINALSLDFLGTLRDCFQGQEDLDRGIIRFIGSPDQRIQEDFLRILRFFRFYAWYGKVPLLEEQVTACHRWKEGLRCLSRERVTKEILRLLEAPNPLEALTQGREIFERLVGTLQLEQFRDQQRMEEALQISPHLLGRLKILWGERALTLCLTTKQKKFLMKLEYLETLPLLQEKTFRLLSSLEAKEVLQVALQRQLYPLWSRGMITIEEAQGWIQKVNDPIPSFPLSGKDLETRGFHGKEIKEALEACRQWWAENHYQGTRKECLEWAEEKFGKK